LDSGHGLKDQFVDLKQQRNWAWFSHIARMHIDWMTVATVIGLLASLIAVLFFGRRDRV
jgi:hypothetical protein